VFGAVPGSYFLLDIRKFVGSSFTLFELDIAFQVKDDPATISLHFFDQLLLVNVNTASIGLLCFGDAHKLEHCPDALSHPIISLSCTTEACFSVACHDGYALHLL